MWSSCGLWSPVCLPCDDVVARVESFVGGDRVGEDQELPVFLCACLTELAVPECVWSLQCIGTGVTGP
jgi:hypothetical protein